MERVYELYDATNGLQEIGKETGFFNLTWGYDIQQQQPSLIPLSGVGCEWYDLPQKKMERKNSAKA